MGLVLLGAKLLDLPLCILRPKTTPIRIYPSYHSVLPPPDRFNADRGHSQWKISLQRVKSVVTVLAEILLDRAPEEFNEVQLAVKLW